MAYKRVLVIQDISCVGQCSMSVAVPILSVMGHETCMLPTAVLSTHTGGFGKPEVIHLDGAIRGIREHWQRAGVLFDAILVGYLGSAAAVDAAAEMIHTMQKPGGISIVDPAMADHGKLYSGLDGAYAAKMEALCRNADVILPNISEAALFARMPYENELTEDYVRTVLDRGDYTNRVILTGVGYGQDETGAVVYDQGELEHYVHPKASRNYSGTGDIFAACFTGALLQGCTMISSVKIAGEFVRRAIENTISDPEHWYGVKFETVLPLLPDMLSEEKNR